MNPLHKATSIRIFLNERTTAVPHAVIYFPRNGIKFGKNNFTKIEMDLSSFVTVSGSDLKDTRPITVKADSRKYHNSRAAALREVGEGKYLSGRWSLGEHRSITVDLALTADRCVGTVICEQKKKTPISAVMKREGINGTEIRLEFNNTQSAAMATKMVIESTKTVSINKELTHADIIEMIKGDKELYHKVACVIRRDRSTNPPRENNLVKQSERFLEEFEQECEAVPANEESTDKNAPKTVPTSVLHDNNEDNKVLVVDIESIGSESTHDEIMKPDLTLSHYTVTLTHEELLERAEYEAERHRAVLMQRRREQNKREGVGEDLAREMTLRAAEAAELQAMIEYQEQQSEEYHYRVCQIR